MGGASSSRPLVKGDSVEEGICFTVGEEAFPDEEGEDSDGRGLSKRDIHTLNEQRRRDVIKVRCSLLVM